MWPIRRLKTCDQHARRSCRARALSGLWGARYSEPSPLDAAPAAPLTPNDLVALFEGAFSFAVLALPFHLSGLLLHGVIQGATAPSGSRKIGSTGHEARRPGRAAIRSESGGRWVKLLRSACPRQAEKPGHARRLRSRKMRGPPQGGTSNHFSAESRDGKHQKADGESARRR